MRRHDDAAVSQEIDDEFVLYTDSDVIFLRDINSCTLPKPRIMAIGPQVSSASTSTLRFD